MRDLDKELEQEYDRFIEFGGLLDKRMRKYLVQYLQIKFAPDRHIIPELNDQYYLYFQKAVNEIFLVEGLMDITKYNEKIRQQIILDTLYWLKKSYKKIRAKNPYEDEQQRLEGWAVTPMKAFVIRWRALPNYLASVYSRDQVDTQFFVDKFDSLIGTHAFEDISEDNIKGIDLMLNDILAQWDALLYAKILEFQMSKFEEEKEDYVNFIDKKVKE